MSDEVLAAFKWSSNAELIADLHRLGYLRDTDSVLDPTYEKGTWWKAWRPFSLTTQNRAEDGSDFRSLPYPDGSFDAIAFDPPYVCPGGRKTSTISEMHDRYGMNEGGAGDPNFRTPRELQAIIDAGVTEMARLVRPARTKNEGGIIVVKCQNYIWSGEFFEGAEFTRDHARSIGLVVVDRLEFLTTPGPQPKFTRCKGVGEPATESGPCPTCGLVVGIVDGKLADHGKERPQVHARRNLSTCWVFRRPRVRAPAQESML